MTKGKLLIEIFKHPTVQDLAHDAGSKAAIAEACGVSVRTVAYWRTGAREPTFGQVLTLARMADVRIEDVRP